MGFMEYASFLDSSKNMSWQVHDILVELWGAMTVLKNNVMTRRRSAE
jgi:hypothetical protein